MSRARLAVAVAAVLAGGGGAARADSRADALFKKGKAQLAAKQYDEACATFEKVDGLEPAIGAKLNIAKCYEDWGKLARAHHWYSAAVQQARAAKDDRAGKIAKLLAALDADVPRLTVTLSAGADAAAAAVTLDARPLAELGKLGAELRVDPGPHELGWRSAGEAKTKTVAIERGGAREITLEVRPAPAAGEPVAAGGDGGAPVVGAGGSGAVSADGGGGGRSVRKIAGIAMVVAGGVGLGVASYLTLDARSSYNDAIDAQCMGAANMCSDDGLRLTRDARSQANTATIIAIAGGAVAVGGLVLWLTAPSGGGSSSERAAYVAPVVGGDGGGVVFGGRF